MFGRDGGEKEYVCIYISDACSAHWCCAHRAPYLGFTHWHNCLVHYSCMQIDCIGTEHRRTEEHPTLIIASQIAALCNRCKNKWHCLSISGFQLPDHASYRMYSLVVVLLSASYGIAQYHISPNSFFHICVLSEETLKGALASFTIFFQYLYHEYTDTREISNPLLLVILWDLKNR